MNETTKLINTQNEKLWQARFDDSDNAEKRAKVILRKAEENGYHRGAAYAMLNIASCSFYKSKNEIALKHISTAFKWFDENKHEKGYVRALILKGNIFESFGDYEKALQLWLEAYNASVSINDNETEGEACSQLGLIYSRLSNFTKALEYLTRGLKIREELGDENAMASSLNRIGMVLRQTKRYEESLEYYFRSLEIRERNKQTGAVPWTLLGIANTYEDQKKYDEAIRYYKMGISDNDKRCSLQCKMGAGRIFSLTGDQENAEKYLTDSLSMAQELNSLVLTAEAQSALADHYERFKEADKALRCFKLYLRNKEQFQSNEVQSRLSNIEVAHAVEKSEQEKEIYRLRHVELKKAYDIIDEKNKDITSSISYASRIQRALLPDPDEIRGLAGSSFILYLPRDIVSGDFYWFSQVRKKLVITAGDCTGHGVPGALMSMLGLSFLEEIVNNREITDSARILNELRKEVIRALKQRGVREETKDGMDISLCVIDRKEMKIQYSGAYNNLYLIRGNDLMEFQADRMPIGIFDLSDREFRSQEITYEPGDIIYLFSDGYADQFGGPNGKKFKYSGFKEMLLEISSKPLKEQKKRLEKDFLTWKGDNPQTDDVVILGVKL